MMFIAVALAFSVLCGDLCSRIAISRGRRPRPWMVYGTVFAPVPLLLLLLLPARRRPA